MMSKLAITYVITAHELVCACLFVNVCEYFCV